VLFGSPRSPFRPVEATAESGLVLLLGVIVLLWTRRILSRMSHLESMIVVYGWSHRIKLDARWVSLEIFLHEHRAETTHGICPACTTEMLAAEGLDTRAVSGRH
jgi:hypothetical protein